MANLSITATQVQPNSNTKQEKGYNAGATITAGMAVYVDTGDSNLIKPATASGTALQATVIGIALNGASAGQPVSIATGGTVTIGAGASISEGDTFSLSATAGLIAADADISTSTHYKSVIGVGNGADGIELAINNSGQQIP